MKDLLEQAIIDAKKLKEVAIAEAKQSLIESFNSEDIRKKAMASLLEGEDTESSEEDEKEEEGGDKKETTDSEETEQTSDDPGKESGEAEEEATDDEITEIMKELAEEDELEEGEDLEESELDESDEEEVIAEFANIFEDDELEEYDELTEEDELEEGDELEESEEELNEQRLRKLKGAVSKTNSVHAKLREAAYKIVQLKKQLGNANKVINVQHKSIEEVTSLKNRTNIFNKINDSATLTKEQKVNILKVLDSTKTDRELKIAYVGIMEALKSNTSRTNRLNNPEFTSKLSERIANRLAKGLDNKTNTNTSRTNRLNNPEFTSKLSERIANRLATNIDRTPRTNRLKENLNTRRLRSTTSLNESRVNPNNRVTKKPLISENRVKENIPSNNLKRKQILETVKRRLNKDESRQSTSNLRNDIGRGVNSSRLSPNDRLGNNSLRDRIAKKVIDSTPKRSLNESSNFDIPRVNKNINSNNNNTTNKFRKLNENTQRMGILNQDGIDELKERMMKLSNLNK